MAQIISKLLQLQDLKGGDAIDFLRKHKAEVIRDKSVYKVLPTKSDTFIGAPTVSHKGVLKHKGIITKDMEEDDDPMAGPDNPDSPMITDGDTLDVSVVMNTANWIDSHMDMLLTDCWKNTLAARQKLIVHIHDHVHQISAKVGELKKAYSKNVKLTDLGLQKGGITQCLVFDSLLYKNYNEKIYNQYNLGKVNQHSIGLNYVKLSLAINDEEDEKNYDFWTKYLKFAINPEVAEERGYFWVVPEIKLLEGSCVLFGSNELTPTIGAKSTEQVEPSEDIQLDPPRKFVSMETLAATKFLN